MLISGSSGIELHMVWNNPASVLTCGPGSVVGIATGYGLDDPGIESRWGRDFPHLSKLALRPTRPPVQWAPGLSPGVKSGRGVTLTSHPHLVPWSWKSRAIPLLPLWEVRAVQSLSACTRVHFTLLYSCCCWYMMFLFIELERKWP